MASGFLGSAVPAVTMSDGWRIPQLGFGTYPMRGDDCYRAVRSALDLGYRLVDTAAHYRNEAEVGRAIRDSGIPRDEIVVTSKMFGADQGERETPRGLDDSLARMGLDYLDLFLIHWPMPRVGTYRAAYTALVALSETGRLRSVGVSNFRISELEAVVADTGVVPAVNQIQLHPAFAQAELRAWHAAHGTVTEAWSPLARGAVDAPVIRAIAERDAATPAQIVLAWHLAIGNVAIPKTADPDRQAENLAAARLTLGPDDIDAITALDVGAQSHDYPEIFEEYE